MITDSHCHLDYSNLYDQLDKVIERATINKVKYLLTICTTLDSFDRIKKIIKKHKNIYGTFGISGFNKIEIFAIWSSAKYNMLFICETSVFLSFHGSSSLIYLFVKKLILMTDLI